MDDLEDMDLEGLDDVIGDDETPEPLDPAEAAKQLLDGYLDELNSGSSLHSVTRSALNGDEATEVAACLDRTGFTLLISNGAPGPVLASAWFNYDDPQHRGALRALRGVIDQALEQPRRSDSGVQASPKAPWRTST